MESKTNAPSFTVSLRGYDRMEVDEYLDSLAEGLGQVEQAEDRVHGMQAHIDRLHARIAELEDRIRSEVPRSGALLGERIAIMLQSAEETAADTINRAQAQASELLDKAHQDVAAAEDQARGATQRGEEQARRIEAAARAEAAEIIAEAESRASIRTRQIEQWAEQVISHTRSEEARMLTEQQEKRERAEADLRDIAAQREAVAAGIALLRDQLGQALDGVRQAPPISLPEASPEATPSPEATAAPEPPAAPSAAAAPSAPAAPSAAAAPSGPAAAETLAGMAASTAPLEVEGDAAAEAEPETDGADSWVMVAEVDPVDRMDQMDDEMPWPSAFRPLDEDEDEDLTGGFAVVDEDPGAAEDVDGSADDTQERDDFDDKFDAWVTGSLGPRHFRRL